MTDGRRVPLTGAERAKRVRARKRGEYVEPVPPRLAVEAGQRFGRLTVIDPRARKFTPSASSGGWRAAECRCDCGSAVTVPLANLLRGDSRSCGCFSRDQSAERGRSHGLRGHPLYRIYQGMMQRCYNPSHHAFSRYGGRGIVVCPQWHDIRGFVVWIEANLGPRPDGMTLDRYPDNDGNYEPGNVRWATRSEQQRNKGGRSRRTANAGGSS